MKQKYVIPQVLVIGLNVQYSILAGSDNKGEGEIAKEPTTDIEPGNGDGLAKDHNFNAWESWDEY